MLTKVTKQSIVNAVAEKTLLTKKDIENVVNETFGFISQSLVDGSEVRIHGLGTLKTTERSERKGRNPKTGEAITIPARKAISFSASKTIKDAVNA